MAVKSMFHQKVAKSIVFRGENGDKGAAFGIDKEPSLIINEFFDHYFYLNNRDKYCLYIVIDGDKTIYTAQVSIRDSGMQLNAHQRLTEKLISTFSKTRSIYYKAHSEGTKPNDDELNEYFDVLFTDEAIEGSNGKWCVKFILYPDKENNELQQGSDERDTGSVTTNNDSFDLSEKQDNSEYEYTYESAYDKFIEKNPGCLAENRIYYGTPGCGKSYYLNEEVLHKKTEQEELAFREDCIFRTTFYPDYTNADFVGQILPHIEGEIVSYEFMPGVFSLALDKAIANRGLKVALVIEEINRGNAPCIFGDIFQLLDRNEHGISRFAIVHPTIVKYLKRNNYDDAASYTYKLDSIKLPSNLFIFATMNTSDQNVFTLDTAFKRRWKMTKIKNTFSKSEDKDSENGIGKRLVPGFGIMWQDFVEIINEHIIASSSSLNAEDKQIGKYFVTETDLVKDGQEIEKNKITEFAEKVIEYIWSDVAKFNRSMWFDEEMNSFDKVLKRIEEGKANTIFVKTLTEKLWKKSQE